MHWFYLGFWIVLAIVFIVIEIETCSLITVWFGIGAVIAAIVAGFGAIFWLQMVVFLVVSIAVLLLLRPYMKKRTLKQVVVNADRNIGKTGTILTPATDKQMGQIRIGGQVWSYIAEGNQQFLKDEQVVVLRIEGVKVIVDKIDKSDAKDSTS